MPEDRNKKLKETVERQLREGVKTQSELTSSGFLAEESFCTALERAGVPFVRSPEAGNVDGVFVRGAPESSIPSSHKHPNAAWKWVEDHTDDNEIRFLPFDVKYYSLMPGGLKELDYAYLNPHKQRATENASIYVLMFESIPDYVAIVPKGSWELSTDFAYGIQPLLNRCPAWCFPFMVHTMHIAEAVHRMLYTEEGAWYVNPTTRVQFSDFIPRLTSRPPIWPVERRMVGSLKHMRKTWTKLQESGCRVHMNPIQPLWCDFLLANPQHQQQALRVEFKLAKSGIRFDTGERSPFAPGRQWHVLICKLHEKKGYYCFLRHEIDERWAGQALLDREILATHWYPATHAGFVQMVNYIFEGSRSTMALEAVSKIIACPPAEYSFEVMVSSNSDRARNLQEVPSIEDLRAEAGRVHHIRSLPWLCHAINRISCERGYDVVFLPLDVGHPLPNHIAMCHKWTTKDRALFRDQGLLPATTYDRTVHDREVSIFYLVDMSVGTKGSRTYPLYMRQAYWTHPSTSRRFTYIGSPLNATLVENSAVWDSYLYLPSQATKVHAFGVKPAKSARIGDQGEGYWSKDVLQHQNALPQPVFANKATEVFPLKQGSAFMSDDRINPLRYILPLETICQLINDIMSGDDQGQVIIQNPQSNIAGLSITKGEYRMKMCDVHQAAWDHSLIRKPAKKGKSVGNSDEDEDEDQ